MDFDEDFDEGSDELSEIMAVDETITLNLLPEKSRKRYEAAYNLFLYWQRRIKKQNSFSENTLLTYFDTLSRTHKVSSVASHYTMLRTTINMNHNINIASYSKLRSFLKEKPDRYVPQKTKAFSSKEIEKFIDAAPDEIFLATKVALIMGVIGTCHKNELYAMKFKDLTDLGETFLVNIPNTGYKTSSSRMFTITDEFYELIKKYIDLRPQNCTCPSFFLNFRKGQYIDQNIGINKFGLMGQEIANFLKLPDPQLYMGHIFRKSSANFLKDRKANKSVRLNRDIGNENSNRNQFSSHNLKRKFAENHIAIVNIPALVGESSMSEEETIEEILPDNPKNPLQIDETTFKIEIHEGVIEARKPPESSKSQKPPEASNSPQIVTNTSEAIESILHEPTLANVSTLLINILNRVEVLEQNLNKTNALLEKVAKNIIIIDSDNDNDHKNGDDKNFVIFRHYNFPLEKDSDVEQFNKLLSSSKTVLEDFQTYIKYLMRSSNPSNLPQVFSKIISDNAFLSFNWSGTKNKKSFIGNAVLCNAIYDAIKCEDFGFSEYEAIMKTIVKISHRRMHSINFRKKRKREISTSFYSQM